MNEYKFYDTNSLLLKADTLFNENENIVISSITLSELEHIKTSAHKDADVKYAARKLLRILDTTPESYDIVIYQDDYIQPIADKKLEVTNDTKILACALWYDRNIHPDETIFVTNDLALKMIANLFFGEDSIETVNEDYEDDYSGYKEIHLTNDELTIFYQNPNVNHFNLQNNEYLIIYNDNKIIDRLCWTGKTYRHLNFQSFKSKHFGDIKPKPNDTYQQLAFDSLNNNQITMLKGPAGSGKSYIALSYLLSKLEKGKIDKIIIFCNTVAVKGAAKLGYYPGDKNSKLLDSQIGNFLSSKLGDKTEVERLINDNELILLPLADLRGYDTTGLRAGIYITEAQNMDISLMKLALQRIGEDSICIIDGDYRTQLDDISYAGSNNGMRRMSQVFRGQEFYGEVELRHIHRSRIANVADQM